MTALAIFCAFWLLLMLLDLYSFIYIKRLQSINYKTITVRYKSDGKHLKEFPNVTNYKVDKWGQLTFYDTDNILHCAVSNWKITKHSED